MPGLSGSSAFASVATPSRSVWTGAPEMNQRMASLTSNPSRLEPYPSRAARAYQAASLRWTRGCSAPCACYVRYAATAGCRDALSVFRYCRCTIIPEYWFWIIHRVGVPIDPGRAVPVRIGHFCHTGGMHGNCTILAAKHPSVITHSRLACLSSTPHHGSGSTSATRTGALEV